MRPSVSLRLVVATLILMAARLPGAQAQADGGGDATERLLNRAAANATAYVTLISSLTSTEHVTQFKLDDRGRTISKRETAFDHLVQLSETGSRLTLLESRLPLAPVSQDRKNQPPLLVSDGLSLLFLVFHPYYAPGFAFEYAGEETYGGRQVVAIRFAHVRGARTPIALAVRGREYGLDLGGTAWLDADTAQVVRMVAGLDADMSDIGLRKLLATIEYIPVAIGAQTVWVPGQVTVDVESRQQHWRNLHQFSRYKKFGVDTTEQVTTP